MGQMFSVVSFLPARGIVHRGLFEDKYDEPTIQMLTFEQPPTSTREAKYK
jgi:hypothetical protein